MFGLSSSLQIPVEYFSSEQALLASNRTADELVVIGPNQPSKLFLRDIFSRARVVFVGDKRQIDQMAENFGRQFYQAEAIVVLASTALENRKALSRMFLSVLVGHLLGSENSCHWGYASVATSANDPLIIEQTWAHFAQKYLVSKALDQKLVNLLPALTSPILAGRSVINDAEFTTDGVHLAAKFSLRWQDQPLDNKSAQCFAFALRRVALSKTSITFISPFAIEILTVERNLTSSTQSSGHSFHNLFVCNFSNLIEIEREQKIFSDLQRVG